MKTRALALLALAAALGGCRENLTSVAATGFCWPPDDADTCGAPSCELQVTGAFYYASVGSDGQVHPLESWIEWENNMENNAVEGERTNTNDFLIEGYDWTVKTPVAEWTGRDRFTIQTTVPAAGSRVVAVDVIPVRFSPALVSDYAVWSGLNPSETYMPVRVEIKAFGRLGTDEYYETGTTRAAVNFADGSFALPACPNAGDVLIDTCPRGNAISPVTLECQAPPDTTTP